MNITNQFRKIFNGYLEEQTFTQQPEELYNPVNYIMKMGGKRLRPVLVMLGQYLFDEAVEKSLPVAFAVELFHNFSLIHDDIIDQAPLRRQKPTVHEKYGMHSGILSGDVMLIYTYKYLNQQADLEQFGKLLDTFNQVAIQVCEGQQMDINFEQRSEVSLDQYLKMIELKTAVLIACSLSLGAIVGGGSAIDIKQLHEFGRFMGIAFQLQDDILDTYGDEQKFGKQIGGDILNNKKTFLVTKAMEVADTTTKSKLRHYLDDQSIPSSRKIKEVLSIFDDLHILDAAKDSKNTFQERALRHLEQVDAPQEKKDILIQLSQQLLDRQV